MIKYNQMHNTRLLFFITVSPACAAVRFALILSFWNDSP